MRLPRECAQDDAYAWVDVHGSGDLPGQAGCTRPPWYVARHRCVAGEPLCQLCLLFHFLLSTGVPGSGFCCCTLGAGASRYWSRESSG